jgi:hypothetical protein
MAGGMRATAALPWTVTKGRDRFSGAVTAAGTCEHDGDRLAGIREYITDVGPGAQ